MFGFIASYEEAYAEHDCQAAIRYAHLANRAGRQWLGIDADTTAQAERWKISGTYEFLYKAYKCQADAAYTQQRYAEALRSYEQALKFLHQGDFRRDGTEESPAYHEENKAWLLNDMALCYGHLQQPVKGDTFFLRAAKLYRSVHQKPDDGMARLAANLAYSQRSQGHYEVSNQLYRQANRFLARDTTQQAYTDRTSNAIQIALNHIGQDSIPQALSGLQALHISSTDSTSYYLASFYTGICFFKQSRYAVAEQFLLRCLRHYQKNARDNWTSLVGVEIVLAYNFLSQAKYAKAMQLANTAQVRITKKSGSNNAAYYKCSTLLASIHKAQGHYTKAAALYQQELRFLQSQTTSNTMVLPGIQAELAELSVTLDELEAARSYAAQLPVKEVHSPSQTPILTAAAYVAYASGQYPKARAHYQATLRINRAFGTSSSTTGYALNGLGLVAMAQHDLPEADSLFGRSLQLHRKFFTGPHPATASVLLNYSQLRIQQNRHTEADAMIQEATAMLNILLPADHDALADAAPRKGELARRQGQPDNLYFQRAFAIYNHKFGSGHWKTKQARAYLTAAPAARR
ncbi:tetratricopeptide repeat protein [Microvirga sp. STR05]|uniref:Tetratricopeptide repeat protein n=1 Tax=Hymenobacter duratus TaxID=2771356 RepID=A0ABR8JK49_9BACT|nr:tetratricopeptide repeat protein [Hymenobacter duratus]MBD2716081.1 tetratricopeptide repeat protein [Hymenobacter duratus]MBR7950995.1 tetratricopeptide repeat protein [Microvirga sp. STR05]